MERFDGGQVDKAVKALQDHKLLLVPTDTVYGLSAVFGDLDTLERLRMAKGRPEQKPIPVAVSSIEMAQRIADLDESALALMKEFLPGALTLIVRRKEDVDKRMTNGKETLALRIPDHPVLLALIDKLDEPLFLTSANLSGKPEAKNFEEALALELKADGIIEGQCAFEKASTIVDISASEPKELRKGPITMENVKKALRNSGLKN